MKKMLSVCMSLSGHVMLKMTKGHSAVKKDTVIACLWNNIFLFLFTLRYSLLQCRCWSAFLKPKFLCQRRLFCEQALQWFCSLSMRSALISDKFVNLLQKDVVTPPPPRFHHSYSELRSRSFPYPYLLLSKNLSVTRKKLLREVFQQSGSHDLCTCWAVCGKYGAYRWIQFNQQVPLLLGLSKKLYYAQP